MMGPLFECGDPAEQAGAVEIVDRDGHAVVRLREGVAITPDLINHLNDLVGGDQGDEPSGRHAAAMHRSGAVVVVVVP